ncbi:MAG TPA: hypothetical protein ENN90_01235 [Mariniphaga anaerophila]|uniref:Uncharacterized protein n=1 Tax=Mariniphaga anaerophila TaxID=1484053 RepID=A0A831LIH8_9BACT|nr:hypothetical protein [Mariniphaga anaerophila]
MKKIGKHFEKDLKFGLRISPPFCQGGESSVLAEQGWLLAFKIISNSKSPLDSPFGIHQPFFMTAFAAKGGRAPNNCLRFIRASPPLITKDESVQLFQY